VKKLLCFLLSINLILNCTSLAIDESFLIRRAYLELRNHVPTANEIEWYCVYNTNGYELAVEWLVDNNTNWRDVPKEYIKVILNSKEFKERKKNVLSEYDVLKNLFYITGTKGEINNSNIRKASLMLVKWALDVSNSETEAIDYICTSLMSRNSNLEEINILNKMLRNSSKSEEETWLNIVNTILNFEDVRTK
jgi:hypothetical protein